MKTFEIKKLIKIQIIIFIGIIGIGFLLNHITFCYFKKMLINHNEVIVGVILDKHPELEEEVIASLLSKVIPSEKYLNKYDLDNTKTVEQLSIVKDAKSSMFNLQIAYLFLAFILLNIPYIYYIRSRKKQVDYLNDDISRVLNDDFQIQISDYDEKELSNLKNNLQKMIMMLKDYNQNMLMDKIELEKTLSDISHQIKTPLTSMYVINDLLNDDKINKTRQKELLLKNRNQLERIEWLVTSLLKISRLDSGVIILKNKPVSAKLLINNVIEPLTIQMELKKQELILNIDDIYIDCDFSWTTEALVNILKNAYEHTLSNGIITITVTENPIYASIVISDNGTGIDKKDVPHIFKRFYKASSNPNSIGIGLNMAYTIITKQSGDIIVKSNKDIGTVFTIKFYKNND